MIAQVVDMADLGLNADAVAVAGESAYTIGAELTNVDSPYITPSRVPSATTVTGVSLTVPCRTVTCSPK